VEKILIRLPEVTISADFNNVKVHCERYCKGMWAIAQSLIRTTTITPERLQQPGYESMPGYYEKVSPQLNEPLYLPAGRQVRGPYVQWCERCTSSPASGEAAYSIGSCFYSLSLFFKSIRSCNILITSISSFEITW